MADRKYLTIRVSLLEKAFQNRQRAFDEIIAVAIKDYSEKIEISEVNAFGITLYDFFYFPESLPKGLFAEIQKLGIEKDEFNAYSFTAEGGEFSSHGWEIFLNDINPLQYPKFGEIMEYGRVKTALKRSKIEERDVLANQIIGLEKMLPEPMAMISVGTLSQYRDSAKTEFDIALLCVYAALKSILGKDKPFVKTNKKLVMKRAFPTMPEMQEKYSTKSRWARLIRELENHFKLVYYSLQTRGFYVSCGGRLTLVDLIYHVEKRKIKNVKQNFKVQKQEAKKMALLRIQNERPCQK